MELMDKAGVFAEAVGDYISSIAKGNEFVPLPMKFSSLEHGAIVPVLDYDNDGKRASAYALVSAPDLERLSADDLVDLAHVRAKNAIVSLRQAMKN